MCYSYRAPHVPLAPSAGALAPLDAAGNQIVMCNRLCGQAKIGFVLFLIIVLGEIGGRAVVVGGVGGGGGLCTVVWPRHGTNGAHVPMRHSSARTTGKSSELRRTEIVNGSRFRLPTSRMRPPVCRCGSEVFGGRSGKDVIVAPRTTFFLSTTRTSYER
jgi:hypothetical protein